MANGNPSTPEDVSAALRDVAFRANRLREWMELERPLRIVELSFNRFNEEQRKANKNTFGGKADELAVLWSRCRDTELVDLASFAGGIRHINQPLPPDPGNRPTPQAIIQELVQVGDQIETAIVDVAFEALRTNCVEFQRRLLSLIADRRNIANVEVLELCNITLQLQEQLKD